MTAEELLQAWATQNLNQTLSFKKGDVLTVVADGGTPFYQFEKVNALSDIIEGVFPDRPFIRVGSLESSQGFCIHASRLVKET